MSNNKKLTVILPTFNREQKLSKSLEIYLCASRNDEIEFFIIDNASPDNTESIMHDFVSKYQNISYVRNPVNIGYGRNLFRGFLEVKTEYFMIIPDDAFVTEGFFNEMLNNIDTYPSAGVINNYLRKENSDGKITSQIPVKTELLKSGVDAFMMTYYKSCAMHGIIYKTELVDPNLWLLDGAVYPQVRLSCEIAINHDILYVSSKEYVLSIAYDDHVNIFDSIDDDMRRPVDFGIVERLNILLDVANKLPLIDKNKALNTLLLGLFSSALKDVFITVYKIDKVYAFKFFRSLLEHSFIKSSSLFWTACIYELILKKGVGLLDKIKIVFTFLSSLAISIFNPNLYRSSFWLLSNLTYLIQKILKKHSTEIQK